MASSSAAERFRFLYRQADGVLDRGGWARASLAPLGVALAMTLIWLAIAPNAPRDLAHERFLDLGVVAVHFYFIVYAFAVIICAVAEYFVSAKRFADRGRPPALAGLAAARRRGPLVSAPFRGDDAGGAALRVRRSRDRRHRLERRRARLWREPPPLTINI